jgi:hypothetical protein
MAQTIQILRTSTNVAPTTLLPGALSAELGPQTKLWIGSGSGNRLLLSSDPADSGAAGGAYLTLAADPAAALQPATKQYTDAKDALRLALTGGTLTGPLTLAADPAAALQPATKQYVDAINTTLAAADTTIRSTYLPLAGGTLTGALTLAADPAAPLQAATRQYVDAKPSGATILASAPSSPTPGQLWWDSVGGQLYVYYNDGTSQQWVPASTVPGNTASINNVGRNLLHNGRFNVQQRGAGTFTAPAYTADRWRTIVSGCTGTMALYPTSAPDETLQWQANNVFTGSATAGAFYFFTQSIEGVKRLGGTTVTISFWGSTGVGSLNLGVILSQVFGTGGSPSPTTFSAAVTVVLTPVWQRFTVTIAVPSASGKTLGTNGDDSTNLIFIMSQQGSTIGVQSGTIALAGVQLEVGSVATPLEKPDPRYDLANCQRFYQTGGLSFYAYTTLASAPSSALVPLAVSMRALPTLTSNFSTLTNATGQALSALSLNSLAGYVLSVAPGYFNASGTFTASADL